jgi:hypothetical protein
MADRWLIIDNMVAQLGDLYALELEAASFPEVAEEPAVQEIHLAVLRAADAMSRIGSTAPDLAVQAARVALEEAVTAASVARRVLAQARAARNRRV